jgi:hypothetical protein
LFKIYRVPFLSAASAFVVLALSGLLAPTTAHAQIVGKSCGSDTGWSQTAANSGTNMSCINNVWQFPAYQFGLAWGACNSATAGMVQWTGSALQLCNGTSWTSPPAGAGGSTGNVQYNSSGSLAGSNNLFWNNSSGFLGIGTAAPGTLLNVFFTNSGTSLSSGIGFELTNFDTTNNDQNLVDFTTSDTSANQIDSARLGSVVISHTASAVSGAVAFQTRNAGTMGERMRIDYTGNVGIGTAAPGYVNTILGSTVSLPLTIQGTNVRGALELSNTANGTNSVVGDIWGFNGTSNQITGIDFVADGAANSGRIQFNTANAGTYSQVMVIKSSGNVGIGTTTPYYTLQADGVVAVSTTDYNNTSTGTAFYINPGPTGNNTTKISSWTNGGTVAGNLVINPSGGNVGIGTTTPAANGLTINSVTPTLTFQLSGTSEESLYDDGSYFYVISTSGSNGVKLQHGSTLWTSSSDQRIKKDIAALPESYGLSAVERLKPVTFHWRDPKSPQQLQMGLIAQDVQQVIPELVTRSASTPYAPDGELGIEYSGLVIPLIKAVQELKGDNDNLRHEFEAYKAAHP